MISVKNQVVLLILLLSLVFSLAQDASDCDVKYGCFRDPPNCQNTADCKYLIKWTKNNKLIDFLMYTKLNSNTRQDNKWFAIGFNDVQKMDGTSVIMCINGQKPTIQTWFNNGYTPSVLDPNTTSIGLTQTKVSYSNGILSCTLSREISIANLDKFLDLNKLHYLIIAKGPVDDTDYPKIHNTKTSSDSPVNFTATSSTGASSEILVQAHGIVMSVAWILFSTIGILIARYYKFIVPEKVLLTVKVKHEVWFIIHRSLMVSVPVLSLVGLGLILIKKEWSWVPIELSISSVHSITGILTIILSVLQPFMAVLRPNKNSSKRYIFNWAHRSVGLLALCLAVCTVFLGARLFSNDTSFWLGLLIFWVAWMFFLPMILELIELSIRRNDSISLNTSLISQKIDDDDESNASFSTKKKWQKIKRYLLFGHIVIAITVTTGILVLILQ